MMRKNRGDRGARRFVERNAGFSRDRQGSKPGSREEQTGEEQSNPPRRRAASHAHCGIRRFVVRRHGHVVAGSIEEWQVEVGYSVIRASR